MNDFMLLDALAAVAILYLLVGSCLAVGFCQRLARLGVSRRALAKAFLITALGAGMVLYFKPPAH